MPQTETKNNQDSHYDFTKLVDRNLPKVENQLDKNSFWGLVQINRAANEIFTKDDYFSQDRAILGEENEAQDLVIRATTTKTFPSLEIIGKEKHRQLLIIANKKEQFSRELILHFLEKGTDFGLKDWEKEVLITNCKVASEFDNLCFAWREEVEDNEIYNKDSLKFHGLINQYTVIRYSEGNNELYEQSYAETFPEEIENIVNQFTTLAEKLEQNDNPETEQLAMAEYLKAYSTALSATNLEELHNLWLEVDVAFTQVKGRLQMIGSREYDYYDPGKTRMFPDMRLSIANKESIYIEPTNATHQAMMKHLNEEFGDMNIIQETWGGIENALLFPETYDIVYTGSLDFPLSGQFLPNEQEVKQEYGVKIFLVIEAIKSSWEATKDLAKKVFNHENDLTLFDNFDPVNDRLVITTTGHEVAEPLLDTNKVRNSLKEHFAYLNEDAATLFITALIPKMIEAGEIDKGTLTRHAIGLLGTYLRYIERRQNESTRTYYLGMGLRGLKRMLNSGFIYQENGELRINPNRQVLDELYRISMEDLHKQVNIADTNDYETAKIYLAKAREVESTNEIEILVNRILGV